MSRRSSAGDAAMKKNLPRIALTVGDPAGIGPEISVRAASDPKLAKLAGIVLYGCPDIIETASAKFAGGMDLKIRATGSMRFRDITVGKDNPVSGREAYNAVVEAVKDILVGKADALVTAPLSKAAVNLAGIPFTGHTELVAELCGTANFAMMQSCGRLRVVFASTHIPLRQVPEILSAERIVNVIELLNSAILEEENNAPRIAVAALNPHAGEGGYMGSEEEDMIVPAINTAKNRGLNVEGPFPPDTLFIRGMREKYDGIVSMYHDQGHIPFKMLAFEKGVNSTLGIPIIRTSVDHGTAYDIAWKGRAFTGSLFEAVRLAAKRAEWRRK